MASSSDQPTALLEADPDFDSRSEYDTDYYSGLESDTTSLITAARNHTFENGRRYHGYKQGKYVLPNDEMEQDRMDLLHHCSLMALHGELFLCPIGKESNPQRIIDLGTGSGIWAIDIADQFPEAQVIGVDLSPIQPNWVPPNVSFEVDDVEEDWQYKSNSFDLIHLRNMASFITDWPRLYSQAFKALKPGGWIEMHDYGNLFACDDGTLPPDNFLTKWVNMWEDVSKQCGREFHSVAPAIPTSMEKVGCVEVRERITKIPVGRWPKGKNEKELGMYWRQFLIDSVEPFCLAFMRVLGWERGQVDEFVAGVKNDLRNTKYHSYSEFYCTYGRKPEK